VGCTLIYGKEILFAQMVDYHLNLITLRDQRSIKEVYEVSDLSNQKLVDFVAKNIVNFDGSVITKQQIKHCFDHHDVSQFMPVDSFCQIGFHYDRQKEKKSISVSKQIYTDPKSIGGNIEDGESEEEALHREMNEELGLTKQFIKLYQDAIKVLNIGEFPGKNTKYTGSYPLSNRLCSHKRKEYEWIINDRTFMTLMSVDCIRSRTKMNEKGIICFQLGGLTIEPTEVTYERLIWDQDGINGAKYRNAVACFLFTNMTDPKKHVPRKMLDKETEVLMRNVLHQWRLMARYIVPLEQGTGSGGPAPVTEREQDQEHGSAGGPAPVTGPGGPGGPGGPPPAIVPAQAAPGAPAAPGSGGPPPAIVPAPAAEVEDKDEIEDQDQEDHHQQ
jgi:hypothetical protein